MSDKEKTQGYLQAESSMDSIIKMLASLEVDYDRLEELRSAAEGGDEELDDDEKQEFGELSAAADGCESREKAEERIADDPASVEVRGPWYDPGKERGRPDPAEYCITLAYGGPGVRLTGDLSDGEPFSARLEYMDYSGGWQEYWGENADEGALLEYARKFSFQDAGPSPEPGPRSRY